MTEPYINTSAFVTSSFPQTKKQAQETELKKKKESHTKNLKDDPFPQPN